MERQLAQCLSSSKHTQLSLFQDGDDQIFTVGIDVLEDYHFLLSKVSKWSARLGI